MEHRIHGLVSRPAAAAAAVIDSPGVSRLLLLLCRLITVVEDHSEPGEPVTTIGAVGEPPMLEAVG